MVRNRGGNRFRYEYKCRSASAPRFRLINTERSGSSSVIVSPIIAANLVSYRADIAENLSITEREGNGIVATFRPRGLRLRGIVLPRFPSVSLQLVHFLNEKYPSIVGDEMFRCFVDRVEKFLTEWMAIFRARSLSTRNGIIV